MGNNLKTTVVLASLAVAVSVYAYVFEGRPDWERPFGPSGPFTDLVREDFVEIELSPGPAARDVFLEASTVPILLRHQKATEEALPRWHIVEPMSFPAFNPRVEGIIRSIVRLQHIKSVATEDAGAFFRDGDVSMTIRIKTRAGEEHRIVIGGEHPEPIYRLVCVRVDDEAFYTREVFRDRVRVTLDSVRDRGLVTAPKDRVVGLQAARRDLPTDPTLTLERNPGETDWKLLPRGIADRELVDRLLNELTSWRIESFVDDELTDPSRYGFDRPRLTIQLKTVLGQEHRLEVADDPKGELDGEVYVRDPQRPFVYTARGKIIDELEKPAEEFRSRYFLQLGASEILDVEGEVTAADGKRAFRLWRESKTRVPAHVVEKKRAEEEDEVWRVEDRRGAETVTYEADRSVRAAFTGALGYLLVERYLDDVEPASAGEAVLQLTLKLDTGAEIGLRFDRPPPSLAAPEYTYVVRREGGEERALVATPLPRDLQPGGIYLRNRVVLSFEREDVDRLKITTAGGASREISKLANGTWLPPDDKRRPQKSLNESQVRGVINMLSELRVVEFLPDAVDKLQELELIPGGYRRKVVLRSGNDVIGSITFGGRRINHEYYAKLDKIEMPVVLEKTVGDKVADLTEHLDEIWLDR